MRRAAPCTSRGDARPALTNWLRLGAGTTGMRYGLRPAPGGVVLHTVIHYLHGVGPEACLQPSQPEGLSVHVMLRVWHWWVSTVCVDLV